MELKRVACFIIVLWTCALVVVLLIRQKPTDFEDVFRPLVVSSITWCPMPEKPEHDLARGAFCRSPQLLTSTLDSYAVFSAKLEHTMLRHSALILFKHINRYYWSDLSKSIPNIAYTLMKWEIMHLKPRQDDLWLEFGVSEGCSINITAAMRGPNVSQPVHGFDSFQGLPEDWYGSFQQGVFSRRGISPPVDRNAQLHVGWFNETLEPFLAAHPHEYVAHVNLDMDLYGGAVYVLKHLMPRFRNGTILHFHEFFKYNETTNSLKGDQEMRALYDALKQSPTPMVLQLMPFHTKFREPAVFRVS